MRSVQRPNNEDSKIITILQELLKLNANRKNKYVKKK